MILQLFPDFMSKRQHLPSGMCLTCNIKYTKMEKGIAVDLQPIFWEELAEHTEYKESLYEDTDEDPCMCEICQVCN